MATSDQRDDVNCALADYQSGKYHTLHKAAAPWHVSKTTLSKRHQGRQNRAMCNQMQQKLTRTEEEELVKHVREQTKAGYPPSVLALRQMANVLLARRPSEDAISESGAAVLLPNTVGVNWAEKFYRRHDEIKTIKIRAMDSLRVCGANPGCLLEWFDIVKENITGVL